MSLSITIIPILNDNYAYLITSDNGTTAIIDPGEAAPVLNELKRQNKKLTYIINTHHHWDHTDGNTELQKETDAKIIAPAAEANKIKQIDIALNDGDCFDFDGHPMNVFNTKGHTQGHLCLHFKHDEVLFSGDTLFSMGCGRLFEGTPQDLFDAFEKIKALPPETLIYPGHEYTLANAHFCLKQDPENSDLIQRVQEVETLRQADEPTIPTSLGLELKTNLFLNASDVKSLAALRAIKDNS